MVYSTLLGETDESATNKDLDEYVSDVWSK
jgi:hypothetical protein